MRSSVPSFALACALFACSASPSPEAATDEGAVVGSEPNLAQLLSATRHVISQRDGAYASVGLDRKVKAAIATLKPAGEVAGGVPCTQPATTLTFEELELSALATATIQCGRGSIAITGGATHPIVVDEAALHLVLAEEARLGDAMWEWRDLTVWGTDKESDAVPRERAGELITALRLEQEPVSTIPSPIGESTFAIHLNSVGEARGLNRVHVFVNAAKPSESVGVRGEIDKAKAQYHEIGTVVVDATPFLRMVPR